MTNKGLIRVCFPRDRSFYTGPCVLPISTLGQLITSWNEFKPKGGYLHHWWVGSESGLVLEAAGEGELGAAEGGRCQSSKLSLLSQPLQRAPAAPSPGGGWPLPWASMMGPAEGRGSHHQGSGYQSSQHDIGVAPKSPWCRRAQRGTAVPNKGPCPPAEPSLVLNPGRWIQGLEMALPDCLFPAQLFSLLGRAFCSSGVSETPGRRKTWD